MGGDKLLDQIFNLKFTAKQLARSAVKCEKEEKAEKAKIKKAIEKGNMEGAKIYAQNAIRKKNEALNYMKLASRLDAVVSRLDTQAKMQMVTKNMAGIVKNLEKSLESNNLEKIAATMNQFEKQFENLDLQTQVVDGVMSAQANLSTPEDEVNSLIQQVADEHGLEMGLNMPAAGASVPAQKVQQELDPLAQRFAELKGK
mmetsp:Transcript_9049/g.19449  ORF Transcript_9049/g.19449 Transcript_9049/m.19449 type:complete len:200 (+) Transcript_9049:111-710(+)|eukprot:CAMPEP_0202890552 /NCGR_PEP_ID=MMETSP1392-20130828/914_1 /ASSEMBLY_ACC=CAM_ASM_000868 /TAXON_ID=225041 /ORGANISM="Chlamydomonas chlamydogama, Strain SAG 11-48b" /LENGTH=199 /DNA_ID=CAMNT_0049574143 /DNA_START=109 /DNA_END=708 /DNA_ORIENTATION=+